MSPSRAALAAVALLTTAAAQDPKTQCLLWYGDGCRAIKDQSLCERARDGRPWLELDGKAVSGQACAWCGGVPCLPGADHLCDVQTFLEENITSAVAAGTAPQITVASCEGVTNPAGAAVQTIQMPPATLRNVTFSPVHTEGQPDWGQACRGSDVTDASNPLAQSPGEWNANYYWIWTATSLAQCMDYCLRNEACTGLEYNENSSYCEVWWKEIQWSQAAQGYQCFKVNQTISEAEVTPDLDCLQWTPPGQGGCGAILDEASCLQSRDGRNIPDWEGFKVRGEPCVWCGGQACTSKSYHMCQPYDYVVHGEGQVFDVFLAKSNYTVARCVDQTPNVSAVAVPKTAGTVPAAAAAAAAAGSVAAPPGATQFATLTAAPSVEPEVVTVAPPEAVLIGDAMTPTAAPVSPLGVSTLAATLAPPVTTVAPPEPAAAQAAPSAVSTTAATLASTTAATSTSTTAAPAAAPVAGAEEESEGFLSAIPWFFWLILALILLCVGGAIALLSGSGKPAKRNRKRAARIPPRAAGGSAEAEETAPLVEEGGAGKAMAVPLAPAPAYSAGPPVGLRAQGLLMPHLQMPGIMPNIQLSQYVPNSVAQYMPGMVQSGAPPHLYTAIPPGENYAAPAAGPHPGAGPTPRQVVYVQSPSPNVAYSQVASAATPPAPPRPTVAAAAATAPAGIAADFDAVDANHDGVITRAEFNQAMQG